MLELAAEPGGLQGSNVVESKAGKARSSATFSEDLSAERWLQLVLADAELGDALGQRRGRLDKSELKTMESDGSTQRIGQSHRVTFAGIWGWPEQVGAGDRPARLPEYFRFGARVGCSALGPAPAVRHYDRLERRLVGQLQSPVVCAQLKLERYPSNSGTAGRSKHQA